MPTLFRETRDNTRAAGIALTLEHEPEISRCEREWKAKTPWLFPDL